MSEIKGYIHNLFQGKGVAIPANRTALFDDFVSEDQNANAVFKIFETQKMLMENWRLKNRVLDIVQQQVKIPNATVGKAYNAKVDFTQLGWSDIIFSCMEELEGTGLIYDNEHEVLSGTPIKSGDIKMKLRFRIKGEDSESELHEKVIPLIINPDPKSLWQNKESDVTDPYWKGDDEAAFARLGERRFVVASKRGRSHANVGSFRDDHYAYKHLSENGWSIIALADGAGSAKFSRKGSCLACEAVIDFLSSYFTSEVSEEFDKTLYSYKVETDEDAGKRLNRLVYDSFSKAAFHAHSKVAEFAKGIEATNKDFYTTLIFCAFKKYDFGYALLTFGVGDCPIAILNKELTEVTLMNWLDVGEFGGGTRFINMPEIFQSENFPTRLKFKLVDDFSYLFLMTDGVYDPKFVVEANLERVEKWNEFISDLKGNNEDKAAVDFSLENEQVAEQLSAWMDFWSPGNHDDRTLAIIY